MHVAQIVALSLLLLGSAAGQDPKTAEEILKRVKETLGKAESITVVFEEDYSEKGGRRGDEKHTRTGKYWFTAENKMRIEYTAPAEKRPRDRFIREVVSNGANVGYRRAPDGDFEMHFCPVNLYGAVRDALPLAGFIEVQAGIMGMLNSAKAGRTPKDAPLDLLAKASYSKFELGEPERIDGRDLAVIKFSVTRKGETEPEFNFRLWIDRKTWLPYKREEKYELADKKGSRIETYKSITLNGEIDPKLFQLPEAKK